MYTQCFLCMCLCVFASFLTLWFHFGSQETTEERVTKEPPYLLFYEREDFDFDKILDLLGGPVNSPEDSSQVGEGGGNISRCRVM